MYYYIVILIIYIQITFQENDKNIKFHLRKSKVINLEQQQKQNSLYEDQGYLQHFSKLHFKLNTSIENKTKEQNSNDSQISDNKEGSQKEKKESTQKQSDENKDSNQQAPKTPKSEEQPKIQPQKKDKQSDQTQYEQPVNNPQIDDGLRWYTILFIIVLVIAGIGGGIFVFLKYRERQIYIQHSQEPEKAIAKKDMTFIQQGLHNTWFLNDSKHIKKDQEAAQKVTIDYTQENVHGKYIRLIFKQPPGHTNTVIALQTIEEQENAYFEVEVDQNPLQSDIIIGLCTDKEYDPNFKLGSSTSSIAFHSISGIVQQAQNQLYDYKFTAVYGETLGLGMRWSDGRVWVSYNGKFLNPPSKSEKFNDKDKDEQQQAQDKQIEMDLDPTAKKAEEEAEKRKIVLQTSRKLFPAISTNGPCIVNLNIGGQAFRISQKELAHGLLFKKDLF